MTDVNIHRFEQGTRLAGVCKCGLAKISNLHPHEAQPSRVDPKVCVCGVACQEHPDWQGPRYRK